MTKRRHLVTIIKRSCLTGKVVWIYRGVSHNAGRHAYWKACKKELEKVKQWAERMADRKRRLTMMLGSSDSRSSSGNGSSGKASANGTSGNMFEGELTDEQRKAARELVRMSKQEPPPDLEFYNHIVEERRRRQHDKDIRRKMREREQKAAEGKDSMTGEK